MTTSTSVHSNAFNFMSYLQSGVDPRTGQYTVSINLPEVKSNGLRGPVVPLVLSYNPLNVQDSGFGLGWNLQLSQYDPGTRIVSLGSGETFKVEGSLGDQLWMPEKKLDSFHFYKQDDTRYRVVHKSGQVEELEVLGSLGNRIALPVRIYSPEGHGITLHYASFGAYQMLSEVVDDDGQVILTITRDSTSVRLLLYGAPKADAEFVMILSGSNRNVARIELPTANKASWRFTYSIIRGHSCIASVDTPVGGHEDVFYQDSGHQFPLSAGREPLPRVTRHLTTPGFLQPEVDVRYAYKDSAGRERNFLGAGLDIAWEDNGLDNLYRYLGAAPYLYSSTETLRVNDVDVRSIERVFNQFHLLALETTRQNLSILEVDTRYYIEEGKPFDQQPNYCQLPKEVRTTWRLSPDGSVPRTEIVSSDYDSYGNLLAQTQANGVTETSEWYSVSGEDGCPPDPDGFVRTLKAKSVVPAQSDYGHALVLVTRYRYKALPALAGSGQNLWLAAESETLLQQTTDGEKELQQTTYTYIEDNPYDAFQYGRIRHQSVTLEGLSTTTDYRYDLLQDPDFDQTVQQTVQIVTGFDMTQKVIRLEHSLFTGEPLLNRDDNDVEIRYDYDNLRRVVSETVSPNKEEYKATRHYEYQLCAVKTDQAEQRLFDVKNVQTTSRFDGLGRVIYEARADADNPDVHRRLDLRQTYEAAYDAWGDKVEETSYDWLDQQKRALTNYFEYDDWDQQLSVTGPDGVTTIEQTDPVGTQASNGPIQRRWTESNDGLQTSEVSETWLNLFDEPTRSVRLDRLDWLSEPVSLSRYQYDGLGRLFKEVSGLPTRERSTTYGYDVFDRVTANTLPDGAVVRRRYAPHSGEDLPAWIGVDHNGKSSVLGEQKFDGLDRIVTSITGGRERELSYTSDLMQPKTVKLPSGRQIDYDYLPELGDEPLKRTQSDTVAKLKLTADYTYDPQNARLIGSSEQGEELQREYYSTGSLKSEQRTSQGIENTMHYRYSRLGLPLSYIDVLGQEQLSVYDDFGRLAQTSLGEVVSDFTYDTFGRTASIATLDSSSNGQVVISLEYDAQGREAQRTFTINGANQQMVQVYDDVDQMVKRTLSEGAVIIREEHYGYDLCGRLTQYDCSGKQRPVDPYGMTISRQVFSFDGLNNLTLVTTTFDGGRNRARYFYEGIDPAQLTRVTNTQLAWVNARLIPVNKNDSTYPPEIRLTYDPDGNLITDEADRLLSYDPLGRLLEVSMPAGDVRYRYDPQDRLAGETGEQRFYRDGVLASQLGASQNSTYMRGDGYLLAEQQGSDALLFSTSISNSVLSEVHPDGVSNRSYTVYGHSSGDNPPAGRLGYNGELHETETGWQLLGNGYRAYNPVLMRFHSPDSWSPFGEGGLNAYAYGEGDSVNGVDPTGHMLRRPTSPPLKSSLRSGSPQQNNVKKNVRFKTPEANSRAGISNSQGSTVDAGGNQPGTSRKPRHSVLVAKTSESASSEPVAPRKAVLVASTSESAQLGQAGRRNAVLIPRGASDANSISSGSSSGVVFDEVAMATQIDTQALVEQWVLDVSQRFSASNNVSPIVQSSNGANSNIRRS
ncbi:RHS repeat-associated core domain-containing protein [Pseudomonas syringae group genomosp. 3]|uniref:Sugar-binding protein n=1 Tax=Pseudomonas syringae group genomosp. 3 TaxID=251701 RepID=A0ABD6VHB3_9PSED|nr:RHS repeat-associated core domain-containing protein [Pseudomonas syringae group genomosp. 3]POD72853.1 sugar-binding protein [Pseudomonas syringae group genomosp. 3]